MDEKLQRLADNMRVKIYRSLELIRSAGLDARELKRAKGNAPDSEWLEPLDDSLEAIQDTLEYDTDNMDSCLSNMSGVDLGEMSHMSEEDIRLTRENDAREEAEKLSLMQVVKVQ